jgi:hypothetical protein
MIVGENHVSKFAFPNSNLYRYIEEEEDDDDFMDNGLEGELPEVGAVQVESS